MPKAVSRHLAIPEEGKSAEWILAEMAKMDGQLGPNANWRHAKLSGAVYRTSVILHSCYSLSQSFKQTEGRIC